MKKRIILLLVLVSFFILSLNLVALGADPFDEFFQRFHSIEKKIEGFTIKYLVYALDEPEEGRFRVMLNGFLPKKEGKREYVLFLSSSEETVIESINISRYPKWKGQPQPKLEIRTDVVRTEEGYSVVLGNFYCVESGDPIQVEITVQLQDKNSLSIENGYFRFSRKMAGGSIIIYLPSDYVLAHCNYPVLLTMTGKKIDVYNVKGETIELIIEGISVGSLLERA